MNDAKQMISVRIVESDRIAVKAIANRLLIRESDVYRFAVNYFLNRFDCLGDIANQGSDLLLPFCEIRHELIQTLAIKKHLLERIFNSSTLDPDKYVAMSDIELLLLPDHLLKQRLLKLQPDVSGNLRDSADVEECLKNYLIEKYKLNEAVAENRFFTELTTRSK